MTARGIAARLVAKYGHDYATGYVSGRLAFHIQRGKRFGKTEHSCVRVVLWRTVGLALGRLA